MTPLLRQKTPWYPAIGSDSKMPNISETGQEIFTKFSGFGAVIPRLSCAKYGGDLPTQFLCRRWESWTFDPTSPKWEVRGSKFFLCSGGLWVLKNKILASGRPVKGGGAGKIVLVSKKFSETSRQIFTKILGFWADTLCTILRESDDPIFGRRWKSWTFVVAVVVKGVVMTS